MTSRLFPALLRYWRTQRGLSQLELSLEADVSARHVSFLESGRAKPSEAMVLQLLAVLTVPLRDQNEALRAAGFEPRFEEPAFDALSPAVESALQRMMKQHEPYPLTVLDGASQIVRSNTGAEKCFAAFIAEPAALPKQLDMFTLVFDPRFMRPFVVDWQQQARSMVARLHRERLQKGDERINALLERVFTYPDVPKAWRQPDFSQPLEPTFTVRLARGSLRVGFFTTITTFSAPQQVTLDELRIESAFPLDEETARTCEQLSAA